MNEMGIALAWCAAQVTLMGLLAGGLYLAARRFGPAAGSLVVVTSLLVIVALSALAFSPWPRWSVARARASSEPLSAETAHDPAPTVRSTTDGPATEGGIVSEPPEGPSDLEAPDQVSPTALLWEALLDELSGSRLPPEAPPARWTTIVTVLFLVAAGAGILWVLAGLVAVRSCRRRSRPVQQRDLMETVDLLRAELSCHRPIELREADGLVSATTFGWWRPVILLPNEWETWTPAERRAVLAHEIAHIRHHHFLACLAGQLGLALHFYNPLVHWLAGRLRLEQELAADATAAPLAGGRAPYVRTLAEIALRQQDRFVAWPARAFLPTRNTFLRRIQMLRHSRQSPRSLSTTARVLTVGVLLLLGLVVAGLRSPAGNRSALAADASQPKGAATRVDLSCVLPEAIGLVAIRPGEILRQPDFQQLATFLKEETDVEKRIGLPLEEIEQVTWVTLAGRAPSRPPTRPISPHEAFLGWVLPSEASYVAVRTRDAEGSRSIAEVVAKDARQHRFGGHTYYLPPADTAGGRPGYCRVDERTIVIGGEPILKRFLLGNREGAPKIAQQPIWRQIEKDPLIVAIDVQAFLQSIPARDRQKIDASAAAFAPLWEDATTVALGVRLQQRLRVRGGAVCRDEQGAKRWQETLEAAKVLGRNACQQFRATARASDGRPDKALALSALDSVGQLLDGLRVQQRGRMVRVETTAQLDAARVWLVGDALTAARAAAQRAQSVNNLKQIALAMHNYHDAYKGFPAAASYGPDGKPLLSWRVHLLPFMENEALYREFHLDEPWNSPHNIKLLPRMPSIYRSPADTRSPPHSSSYYVLTGPGTVFSGKAGVRIAEIRDGASNTILAVEAQRAVPWTKPEDIPYDSDKPLPKLGGLHKGVFNAAMCDGSVHSLQQSTDERVLRALIEKADGQAINGLRELR